jgi:hypothetical protein
LRLRIERQSKKIDMLETILWPQTFDGISHPFVIGPTTRKFRLTFDSESLANVQGEQGEALDALEQMAAKGEFELFQTVRDSGTYPNIQIGPIDPQRDYISVTVEYGDDPQWPAGIPVPNQWLGLAQSILSYPLNDTPAVNRMLAALLRAQAHISLRRDILVTWSSDLLDHRRHSSLRGANIRTPLETSKIIGLWHRSKGDYDLSLANGAIHRHSCGTYFWVYVRGHLPSMWHYVSVCAVANASKGADLLLLAQASISRCAQAYQARDAMGAMFYGTRNQSSIDHTVYHFTALSLLLSGALDAMARIAHRVYLNRLGERAVTFRANTCAKLRFLKDLRKKGDGKLCDFVEMPANQDVMNVLYTIRNTIHGIVFPHAVHMGGSDSQAFYLYISPDLPEGDGKLGQYLFDAVTRLGDPDDWGIKREIDGVLSIEPYTLGCMLIDKCMMICEGIANYTEVNRLIAGEYDIPPIPKLPEPDDIVFAEPVMKRMNVVV